MSGGARHEVWHTEMFVVGVAQLVRAPGCGPGGRGFETPRPPHQPQGFAEVQVFGNLNCDEAQK